MEKLEFKKNNQYKKYERFNKSIIINLNGNDK